MRRLLAVGPGLALGWLVAIAVGGEPALRPEQTRMPSKFDVTLGRPIPLWTAPPSPERPAFVDPQVTPASYYGMAPSFPNTVVRAYSPEPPAATAPAHVFPTTAEPALLDEQEQNHLTAKQLLGCPVPQAGSEIRSGGVPGAGSECDTWEEYACSGECHCCPLDRLYGSAEYLLWTIKGSRFPPLVTTGLVQGGGVGGNLGGPGTFVLFGGSTADNEERSGGRFTLGYWLDDCQIYGLEGSYFFLGQRSIGFNANSNTIPVLARPFFNVNAGMEDREVVAAPGLATGSVGVSSSSRLWGWEANLRRNVCCGCCYRLDLLTGFRYLELDEGLRVTEDVQVLPNAPSPLAGDHFDVSDSFDTRNRFYGGQIGAAAEIRRGRWALGWNGKVALGDVRQVVNIEGSQLLVTPQGGVQRFQGGLLALPSNIGEVTRDRFAVVPETGINLSYQVTPRLRLFVGYTFLYFSNVVRPGDQIDRALDVAQIPNVPSPPPPAGLIHPAVLFKSTDFWAQGVNFGVEFRY